MGSHIKLRIKKPASPIASTSSQSSKRHSVTHAVDEDKEQNENNPRIQNTAQEIALQNSQLDPQETHRDIIAPENPIGDEDYFSSARFFSNQYSVASDSAEQYPLGRDERMSLPQTHLKGRHTHSIRSHDMLAIVNNIPTVRVVPLDNYEAKHRTMQLPLLSLNTTAIATILWKECVQVINRQNVRFCTRAELIETICSADIQEKFNKRKCSLNTHQSPSSVIGQCSYASVHRAFISTFYFAFVLAKCIVYRSQMAV